MAVLLSKKCVHDQHLYTQKKLKTEDSFFYIFILKRSWKKLLSSFSVIYLCAFFCKSKCYHECNISFCQHTVNFHNESSKFRKFYNIMYFQATRQQPVTQLNTTSVNTAVPVFIGWMYVIGHTIVQTMMMNTTVEIVSH